MQSKEQVKLLYSYIASSDHAILLCIIIQVDNKTSWHPCYSDEMTCITVIIITNQFDHIWLQYFPYATANYKWLSLRPTRFVEKTSSLHRTEKLSYLHTELMHNTKSTTNYKET